MRGQFDSLPYELEAVLKLNPALVEVYNGFNQIQQLIKESSVLIPVKIKYRWTFPKKSFYKALPTDVN